MVARRALTKFESAVISFVDLQDLIARDSSLVNRAHAEAAGIAAECVENRGKVLLAILPESANFSEILRFCGNLLQWGANCVR
jgi:hypothetical protein